MTVRTRIADFAVWRKDSKNNDNMNGCEDDHVCNSGMNDAESDSSEEIENDRHRLIVPSEYNLEFSKNLSHEKDNPNLTSTSSSSTIRTAPNTTIPKNNTKHVKFHDSIVHANTLKSSSKTTTTTASNNNIDVPSYMLLSDEIQECLKTISIQHQLLVEKSQQCLLPFADRERLVALVHKEHTVFKDLVQRCEQLIMQLGKDDLSQQKNRNNISVTTTTTGEEKALRTNMQRRYATDLTALVKLRTQEQRAFETNMRKQLCRDGDPQQRQMEEEKEILRLREHALIDRRFSDEQIQVILLEEQLALERHRELVSISSDLETLYEMFRDLNKMVIEQGSMIDRIDKNIHVALVETTKAQPILEKARDYQKRSGRSVCVVVLLCCIVASLLFLIIKFAL